MKQRETAAWMRKKYVDEKLSMGDMAKLDNCAPNTILRWMKLHGILRRPRGKAMMMARYGIESPRPKPPRRRMRGLVTDKAWMRSRYVDDKLSIPKIAKLADRGIRTVARWLDIHGIKTRSISEAWHLTERPDISGSNNPMYMGIMDVTILVRSYSDRRWRPQIFARDKGMCQCCGSNKNLNAHHIVKLSAIIKRCVRGRNISTPVARMGIVRELIHSPEVNDVGNGVALCQDCHAVEHWGRVRRRP